MSEESQEQAYPMEVTDMKTEMTPDGNLLCTDAPEGQQKPVTLTLPVSVQNRILLDLCPLLFQAWVQQCKEFNRTLDDCVLQEDEADGLLSDLFAAERRRVAGHNV